MIKYENWYKIPWGCLLQHCIPFAFCCPKPSTCSTFWQPHLMRALGPGVSYHSASSPALLLCRCAWGWFSSLCSVLCGAVCIWQCHQIGEEDTGENTVGKANRSRSSLTGGVKGVIFHGNLFISGCWKYASSFSLRYIPVSASHLGSQHAFFWQRQHSVLLCILSLCRYRRAVSSSALCFPVQAEELELLSPLL